MFKNLDNILDENLCGGKEFDSLLYFVHESESSDISFTIKVGTDIQGSASWGIVSYYLGLAKCHHTCLSCTNQSANSCLSCYENAELDQIENVCNCKVYYYMIVYSICDQTPCSRCNPCHTSCLKCRDEKINGCLSCKSGKNI